MTKRMVLILGAPGAGKTRLAGTFPDPLFIDLENGASTAHRGEVNRIDVPTDANTLGKLIQITDQIAKAKSNGPGTVISPTGKPVRTLVVDSIDAVQQAVADFQILQGRRFQMQQRDWGELLMRMRPIDLKLRSLPVHVVVVAHTKVRDSDSEKGVGVMDLSVQGALRDQMPRWYDVILHISETTSADERLVYTDRIVHNRHRWLAKDRHRLLVGIADKNGIITYVSPSVEQFYGLPPSKIVGKSLSKFLIMALDFFLDIDTQLNM